MTALLTFFATASGPRVLLFSAVVVLVAAFIGMTISDVAGNFKRERKEPRG